MFNQGHALLVGVGTYDPAHRQDAPRDVPQTAVDAEQLADILIDPQYCGYDNHKVKVLSHSRATKTAILGWLDDTAAQLKSAAHPKESTVLIFFSGHGGCGVDDTYYLTSYDTRLVKPADWKPGDYWRVMEGTGVSEREFLDRIGKLPAERVLLVINACYSGSIGPTLGLEPPGQNSTGVGAGEAEFGLAVPDTTSQRILGSGEGRVVITACRETQLSHIGTTDSQACTIFGSAVVQGLRGVGIETQSGYITAYELYLKVLEQVSTAVQEKYEGKVQQEPVLSMVKAVGAFPVALHKGATDPDESLAVTPSLSNTPAKVYVPAVVNIAYKNFIANAPVVQQSGNNNQATIVTHTAIVNADNSQGFIGYVAGNVDQRNIDTQGGNYIENNGK